MSAAVLRQAADEIREEWSENRAMGQDRSEWLTWRAVADWLEQVADAWADDPGCDLGGGYDFSPACESCFRCYYYETQMRALAVARAYLGESS